MVGAAKARHSAYHFNYFRNDKTFGKMVDAPSLARISGSRCPPAASTRSRRRGYRAKDQINGLLANIMKILAQLHSSLKRIFALLLITV